MRAGLRGGCDLDCGGFYQKNGMVYLHKKTNLLHTLSTSALTLSLSLCLCLSLSLFLSQDAYSKGTINDDDLDLAMTRLFTYR